MLVAIRMSTCSSWKKSDNKNGYAPGQPATAFPVMILPGLTDERSGFAFLPLMDNWSLWTIPPSSTKAGCPSSTKTQPGTGQTNSSSTTSPAPARPPTSSTADGRKR